MSRDQAWFDGFYREHAPRVHAYCSRRVGRSGADDMVAQVFAVAWRRRDDVPDGDVALRWLYGVARRVVSHHWRGSDRAVRLVERVGRIRPEPVPDPELVAVASAEHDLVRRAVRSLRSLDREVLMLSAWEGLTHREIAEVLDTSLAAVDKRVTRAKVRLAKRYSDLAGGSDDPSGLCSTAVEQSSPVRAREGGGAP